MYLQNQRNTSILKQLPSDQSHAARWFSFFSFARLSFDEAMDAELEELVTSTYSHSFTPLTDLVSQRF